MGKGFILLFLFIFISCGERNENIENTGEYQLIELDYYLASSGYDYIVYENEMYQTKELEQIEEKRNKIFDQVIKITVIVESRFIDIAKESGWFTLEEAFITDLANFAPHHD